MKKLALILLLLLIISCLPMIYVKGTEVTGTFTPLFPGGGISITGPYPVNQSINVPLQPTLRITLNHTFGWTMNISWYYGINQGDENILLGTSTNLTNGTTSQIFNNATGQSTNYYWRVQVNDRNTFVNATYYFKTVTLFGGGAGSSYPYPSYTLGLIGVFGLLGLFVFLKNKHKKRDMEEE